MYYLSNIILADKAFGAVAPKLCVCTSCEVWNSDPLFFLDDTNDSFHFFFLSLHFHPLHTLQDTLSQGYTVN